MALQQFVQQSAQKSSIKSQNTALQLDAEQKTASSIQTNPLSSTARQVGKSAPAHELVSDAPVSLSLHEREVLSSLAAVQIRYNRPAEAVPYLMMLRKTDENDHQAARLLALALMKLGNWEQAEHILENISASAEGDAATGILAFYRSLVAFKRHKLSIARKWLQQFRSLVSGGAA